MVVHEVERGGPLETSSHPDQLRELAVNVGAARFATYVASSEDGSSVSCMSRMQNKITVAQNGHDFISNEV